MPPDASRWEDADAFDLPEWLGRPFEWRAEESLTDVRVRGRLSGGEGQALALDLLCADVAFPAPVLGERLRSSAHQAWHYDQVLLVSDGERHVLAVPAVRLGAELACEALRRFAKAVGVRPGQVSVSLRL